MSLFKGRYNFQHDLVNPIFYLLIIAKQALVQQITKYLVLSCEMFGY